MKTLKDLIDSKTLGYYRFYYKKSGGTWNISIFLIEGKITLSPEIKESEYPDYIVLHKADPIYFNACKIDNDDRIGWEQCREIGRYINKKTGEFEYLVRLEEGGSRIVKESEMLRHGKNDDVFMNWIKENK